MKKISTSALSKKLNIDSKELIELLENNGYIEIKNKSLFSSDKIKLLTKKGKDSGGELKKGTKFGDYIVWPEEFNLLNTLNIENIEYVNVSNLAEKYSISARKMNQIISELGWIEPNLKGWKLTKFGEKLGGRELIINKTGATYTKWPTKIIENKSLLNSLGIKQENNVVKKEEKHHVEELDFRNKFPEQYRTKDGHKVRSRGEVIIDDYLYYYKLSHAYERKLPIEEDVYSDFYIPAQNGGEAVYIEYWGIEDKESYANRKK